MKAALNGMTGIVPALVVGMAFGVAFPVRADNAQALLRKPIPDKLVVLTFDDGPASHATVVAPILKSMGFGGSLYICDFDSFNTRKDWYLTWRQMRVMAAEGFEIGNHTKGHVGGAGIGPFLDMEDQLLAHDIPKPTTEVWPVYQANTKTYPELAKNGYIFGRGGHFRPYRPTVDNPFDVPSWTVSDRVSGEAFVNYVRQAVGGKIVVLCYHGVPDMEHTAVSLDPELFKVQMQYLKDNQYKVICLRDLAEFIDPAKAASLPPTANEFKETEPVMLVPELKPIGTVHTIKPISAATMMPRFSHADAGNAIPAGGVKAASDMVVEVAKDQNKDIKDPIAGSVRLVKNGPGRLQLAAVANTYSGGTVVNEGGLVLVAANQSLATGPLTLNNDSVLTLEHVDGTNPLILNGGEIYAGNGFGDTWNAPIILNGIVKLTAYSTFHLNNVSGGMSGPGGFAMMGDHGPFGPSNSGTVTLNGVNTYTGPTTVWLGTLIVKKAVSLYNADSTKWTADNITVFNTATLGLSVGGKDEFTGTQVGTLLKNLTSKVNHNGLMAGAVFCLDTGNASETVTILDNIVDSKGPGGGFFTFKKLGSGTLRLTGANTYTGQTFVGGGTMVVSSLNSVINGKASSSLGAPKTLETGMIYVGGDGGLTYTGTGEVTDRIIDLTGQKQTVTLDQSGSGLLKFTSPFDISGYGHSKVLVLKGPSAGKGELAGNIRNPYDRKKTATLALTKEGTGTWTLSGINTYTGPTTVSQGTLSIASDKSLGKGGEVSIANSATLNLSFKGEIVVSKLTLGGVVQAPGTYSAAQAPKLIEGAGILKVMP